MGALADLDQLPGICIFRTAITRNGVETRTHVPAGRGDDCLLSEEAGLLASLPCG